MILLTGGTGFVGKEILKRLRSRGHRIRVLARRFDHLPAKVFQDWSADKDIELFAGDITQKNSIKGCCEGVEAVIHLTGIILESGDNTFERVHVEGTRNLLKEATEERVKRFVHMSSLGTRPYARSRYHQTKWEAEELVKESGLDWTIFRPSLIYGPGDSFTEFLASFMKAPWIYFSMGIFPCIGDGKTVLQPVDVGSVADCFVKAVSYEDCVGRVFELGGRPICFGEMLRILLSIVSRREVSFLGMREDFNGLLLPWYLLNEPKPFIFPIPFQIAKAVAFCMERMMPKPLFGVDEVMMLQENQKADTRLAKEYLDFNPKIFSEEVGKHLRENF